MPSGIFIDASIDILLPSLPLPSLYFLAVFVFVLCRTHARSACFPSRPVKLCSASSFAREILGNGVRVRGSISDLLQLARGHHRGFWGLFGAKFESLRRVRLAPPRPRLDSRYRAEGIDDNMLRHRIFPHKPRYSPSEEPAVR